MEKEKKKKRKVTKKILALLITIIIIVSIAMLISKKLNSTNNENEEEEQIIEEEFDIIYEDGSKLNTSEELAKEKKLDELTINNIKLTYQDGFSTLSADVTNNGTTSTQRQYIIIEMLDKEQNIITDLEALLSPLEPGETTQLDTNITSDIANAYDFRVSKE